MAKISKTKNRAGFNFNFDIKSYYNSFKYPIWLFIISRLAIFLLASVFIGLWPTNQHPGFLEVFSQWDGRWYLEIIKNGYWYQGPKVQASVAFFPLYPLLGKGLTFLGLSPSLSLFVVANLSGLGFFIVFWQLTQLEFNQKVADKALFYYAISPLSFLFSAFYSESLFLFSTSLCFYFIRQKKLFKASLIAGLASATRNLGILLGLIIVFVYLKARLKSKSPQLKTLVRAGLYLLLASAGLISYLLFCWLRFNDPFVGFKLIQTAWLRQTLAPWQTLAILFQLLFFIPPTHPFFPILVFDLNMIAASIWLLVLAFKKSWLKPSYLIYISIYLLLILSQVWRPEFFLASGSIGRYLWVLFPLSWILAKASLKYCWLDKALSFVLPTILGVFSLAFFHGAWVE